MIVIDCPQHLSRTFGESPTCFIIGYIAIFICSISFDVVNSVGDFVVNVSASDFPWVWSWATEEIEEDEPWHSDSTFPLTCNDYNVWHICTDPPLVGRYCAAYASPEFASARFGYPKTLEAFGCIWVFGVGYVMKFSVCTNLWQRRACYTFRVATPSSLYCRCL